jgi:SagB-type dehydrogenase family enzyme
MQNSDAFRAIAFRLPFFVALILTLSAMPCISSGGDYTMKADKNGVITLPDPMRKGGMSLEETLAGRESVRNFTDAPLSAEEISQLLWSGQGITRSWGGRTAPSAGALYPLELYIVLPHGFFHYSPKDHQLRLVSQQNYLPPLASAALGQPWVREAPAVIIITAIFERIERKYGSRGERYVKIEVGHAAQNILLQAVSLGLGAVPVGAFYDDKVKNVLHLPRDHVPFYLIPVGRVR